MTDSIFDLTTHIPEIDDKLTLIQDFLNLSIAKIIIKYIEYFNQIIKKINEEIKKQDYDATNNLIPKNSILNDYFKNGEINKDDLTNINNLPEFNNKIKNNQLKNFLQYCLIHINDLDISFKSSIFKILCDEDNKYDKKNIEFYLYGLNFFVTNNFYENIDKYYTEICNDKQEDIDKLNKLITSNKQLYKKYKSLQENTFEDFFKDLKYN